MESLILKQSPPELLLEDVSCKRLILDSEHSVCPCTHSLSQPSPLALLRQNWGCECPAVNSFHQGSSLLIGTFRGNTLAGLCLSCHYRHRLKMSRAGQLGPQHVQSSWYQSEKSLRAAAPVPAQGLVQSHCVQPGAWNQISPPFSPFPRHHLLLTGLNVGSIQTRSIGRGVCQSAAA